MAEKRKFQAIKGTRDLLPPETELWNRVEQTAREVFGTYGFGEIRPPIFEPTELFARAVGLGTDVVSKEMYSFIDNPARALLAAFSEQAFQTYQMYEISEANRYFFVGAVERFVEAIRLSQQQEQLVLDPGAQSETDQLQILIVAHRELDRSPELEKSAKERTLFKQMLSKLDILQFGEKISLRPEATASVCRAYIEHNMHALPQPVKLYYMGPMFRRERPQKGRYRQFYQIGAEVLEALQQGQGGAKDIPKDAAIDAEVIEMVMTFFARLGLEGVELDINSIGHNAPNCRPAYVAKLKTELEKVKDKLGPDSQRRIETNPLRVLDSKLESEQAIIATLPRIADSLCDDCVKHYSELQRQLKLREVHFRENWRLVRGLDYYMRTTFEITAKGLGSQNAVCGGGRYDGLVELLGGQPTKGIGFAIGEDRLILSLQETRKAKGS
jgi:histidyl-tRNA synthetase